MGGMPIDEVQIALLAERAVNRRQIKTAVRTACSLARARREEVGLGHFLETLDAMDEFMEQWWRSRSKTEAGAGGGGANVRRRKR
jgi:predicted chitinase